MYCNVIIYLMHLSDIFFYVSKLVLLFSLFFYFNMFYTIYITFVIICISLLD